MSRKAPQQSEPIALEDQIKRLEEIARILDAGDKNLDVQLALFEEGTRIAESCKEYLQKAELRIEELTRRSENDES